MTTFIGQNLGAGHYQRIRTGTKHCAFIALGVTLGLTAIVYIFSEQCVSLFCPEPEVITVGVAMLRILAPMFWIVAMREVLLGILRGCGRNLWPTILSLIGMVGVRQIFLMFTMYYNPTIENIYLSYLVAWVITLLLLTAYYFIIRQKLLPDIKE